MHAVRSALAAATVLAMTLACAGGPEAVPEPEPVPDPEPTPAPRPDVAPLVVVVGSAGAVAWTPKATTVLDDTDRWSWRILPHGISGGIEKRPVWTVVDVAGRTYGAPSAQVAGTVPDDTEHP